MSIRQRLYILALINLFCILLLGGVSLTNSRTLDRILGTYRNQSALLQKILGSGTALSDVVGSYNNAIVLTFMGENTGKQITGVLADFDGVRKELEGIGEGADVFTGEFLLGLKALDALMKEGAALLSEGNSYGASELYVGKMKSLIGALTGGLNEVVRQKQSQLDSDYQTVMTRYYRTRNYSLGLVALIVFFSLIYLVRTVRLIIGPLSSAAFAAERMGRGEYSSRITIHRNDEIGQLAVTINGMAASIEQHLAAQRLHVEKLSTVLNLVQSVSTRIVEGASEVNGASQTLSDGASTQAAALEEITANLAVIADQTSQNAQNAGSADRVSGEAHKLAEGGVVNMNRMLEAMGKIALSSAQVSKVIKTINEIAFQTNLLALNAAVEAARAGRHGKGFSVVAEEVRALAGRSAKAASESNILLEHSLQDVASGRSIAEQNAESLVRMVEQIARVSGLAAEIAAASKEQSEGIQQVNSGLSQIDSVTQQNAASAEETAAAAQELTAKACELREVLSRLDSGDAQTHR